jgi:hypothetical protein
MFYQVHTLYWPDLDKRFPSAHKLLMEQFNIPVNYHETQISHGDWLDRILRSSRAEVVGFLDVDCIPLHPAAITNVAQSALSNKTISGIVQVANDIAPMSHIYISPACIFIHRRTYHELGSPSLKAKERRYDVAELLSKRAAARGIRTIGLFPTHYEKEGKNGVWRLHNYGFYGIGSVYGGNQFYHLWQCRYPSNAELFQKRCSEVISGAFSPEQFTQSTDFNHNHRIVVSKRERELRLRPYAKANLLFAKLANKLRSKP